MSGKRDPGPLRHVPLCELPSRPVLRSAPARTQRGPSGRKRIPPVMRSADATLKRAAPVAAPFLGPAIPADSLPWKTVEVSKSQFLGLLTNTMFDHDARSKAVKEANAGKEFAKQAAARSLETLLKAPPVLSGPYNSKNQQAREWVQARTNELRWQAFEQAAKSGTMPEFKESRLPRLDQKFAQAGGFVKSAWQLKEGFLGPDVKQIESPPSTPPTHERFVSADGKREVRMIHENGKSRMEFLTIGPSSVSAVKLSLD
jgi:hypothetical protein